LPVEARLLLGFACAVLVAYALTPVAIRVAGRFAFYDVPVGYKAHGSPTPYLGGAAVMAAFLLALLASALSTDAARTAPLAAGVAILWGLGTVDDRRPVSPVARVAVEALLAAGLWALGHGWDIGLGGAVDLVLSVAWIVLVTNAFNLFDNMDGAASTMGFVASAAVAVLGLVQGDAWLAATAGALAGACLGFLPHNMASPARIFLGDGGSMPLGFAVAAIAMTGASDSVAAWQALLVGLLIVGVPLLDTALVIVSRRRRGVSILTGGHDHLTFRTRRHLRTARLAVTVLGGAQALVAALALLSVENGSGFVVLAVLAYLVAAGSTIAILEAEERREAAAEAVGTLAVEPRGAAAPVHGGGPPAPRRWRTDAPALAAIAVLGGGVGLSPFWFGFYDSSVWVPVGMAVISATAAALIARPPRLARPAAVVAAAALLLALWTLASSRWAESAQQAVLSGNRALVLAAVLALALTLVGTRRRAVAMVVALGAGIAGVGGSVVIRLLDGSTALFQGGRLNEPLGYVNAEGTIFVIGFWLAVALAERRRPLPAAAGAALAAAAGTLILLSQSRGAALALAASTAVVVVALPGRRRRLVLLLLLAAVVAAFSGPSRAIYGSLHGLAIDPGTVAPAGRALLAAAVCAGLAWAALSFAAERVAARDPAAAATVRRAVTAGLAVVACVAVAAALVSAGRIGGFASDQYHAFVDLSAPAPSAQGDVGQTRLLSGAGNRYDYWRVAVDVSGTHPLRGIGAGGFDVPYFRDRRTTEDIRQPHSLELQVLSETGIVGILLLLAVLGGAVVGVARAARTAGRSETGRALVVAGTGGATAWLAHTSVDWMHLIPGVTAMALCLLAVVLRAPWSGEAPAVVVARPVPARRRAGVALGVGVAACIVLTGASLARQGLAEHDRGRAQAALSGGDAARALREADQALRLDPDDVSSYYTKASALARFGRGQDARAVMVQAAAREPHDFVTWALLGDLDVRLGHRRQAADEYGRAHRLNPRDAGLARLVADPRGELG
jgi:UDP-GlcNAc:undecaprenyl-phosphate GlcNAc-1-phosphate transferase